jgi:hypothetical protein
MKHNYCDSEHYPLPCFYLKHTTFRILDSVSVVRWSLLSWVQLIELMCISYIPSSQSFRIYERLSACRFPQYFERVEELLLSAMNVHTVNDARQMEIYTAEPLIPEPSPAR